MGLGTVTRFSYFCDLFPSSLATKLGKSGHSGSRPHGLVVASKVEGIRQVPSGASFCSSIEFNRSPKVWTDFLQSLPDKSKKIWSLWIGRFSPEWLSHLAILCLTKMEIRRTRKDWGRSTKFFWGQFLSACPGSARGFWFKLLLCDSESSEMLFCEEILNFASLEVKKMKSWRGTNN